VDPVLYVDRDGRAVYRSGMVPAELGLGTRRQLHDAGLSAAGLKPAAWLHYSALHGVCPLYLRAEARPLRKLTPRQLEVLAEGRKLAGTVVCERCGAARSEYRRTVCPPCSDAIEAAWREQQEREWREEAEAHAAMLVRDRAQASAWAAEVLVDQDAVVLDSETTGLYGSYAVELAVRRAVDREVLLDVRINPQVPIEDGATAVHGITDADVAGEPVFAAFAERLLEVLAGRRVVVYNAEFDAGVLQREFERLREGELGDEPESPWCGEDEPYEAFRVRYDQYREAWKSWSERRETIEAEVKALLGIDGWQCAMHGYAAWFGAWHDYWGNYTWQRLNGPHGAAGDCDAVIDRLATMAAAPARA
jgi:hypothetical protein